MRRLRDVGENLETVWIQAELKYPKEAIAVNMERLGAKAAGRRSERHQRRVICGCRDLRDHYGWQVVDADALRVGRGRHFLEHLRRGRRVWVCRM
jgi:hypothetical protein